MCQPSTSSLTPANGHVILYTNPAYHELAIAADSQGRQTVYLGDKELATGYSEGRKVTKYEYSLSNPFVVKTDADFGVIQKIIDKFLKNNPDEIFVGSLVAFCLTTIALEGGQYILERRAGKRNETTGKKP